MSPKKTAAAPASYEQAVEDLEAIISRLESGQMPLDDMLGAYQRGHELLRQCEDKLQKLEQQVTLIDSQHSFEGSPDE
jgi:exodeoxyribonuclease VII small subunit